MNLENLNLVELNAQEIKETEGGFIHAGGYGLAMDSRAVGDFVCGFFAGLLGY